MGIIRKTNIKTNKAGRIIDSENLYQGILKGDVSMLARSITLIESSLPADKDKASEIIEKCLPHSGKSFRIGITGVPGVGKSTFIESFGTLLTDMGKRIAVLAIDPTSQKGGGSILGDKTRMEELSRNENAFIRPSAAGNSLGGVTRKTKEAIILCEAAGYDVIIIETVGVGQSEIAVNGMVDFFLLLMLAGAGDELQGIKRGIMEMADALIINKADGDNLIKAKVAKAEYSSALHLFPPNDNQWVSPVLLCSAIEGTGINDIWEMLNGFHEKMTITGFITKNRKEQNLSWMNKALQEELFVRLIQKKDFQDHIEKLKNEVALNKISPFKAIEQIINEII